MPYTNTVPALPFSGNALEPRECSREAARVKAPRFGVQTMRYLRWLDQVGQATDAGAAEGLGLPLQSICSIRNLAAARGLVGVVGKQEGRYGLLVTIYELTPVGEMPARGELPVREVPARSRPA